MTKKKLVILLLLAVVVAGVGVYLLTRPSPPERPRLQVTINSWIGWAPLYLAKEKGFFGDLDLEIIRVEDTGARKSTMISGKVDGYASSVDNFALDSAQGVPGKIVMCFDESFGGDGIVCKKSIKTPADLKGKKIGYQKGLISHFLLLTILDKAGLKQSDITHVDMDADKAGAAFVAGHLDAAVTWEPWISKAAAAADGKVLVTTKEFPGLIVDTLVFRDQVLRDRREDVARVIQGWFRALDYWAQHKDEADKIMAKAYGLKVDEFRDMCAGVRFYDLPKNKAFFGVGTRGEIHKLFGSAGRLWKSAGVITETTDPQDKIDPSFIRALP